MAPSRHSFSEKHRESSSGSSRPIFSAGNDGGGDERSVEVAATHLSHAIYTQSPCRTCHRPAHVLDRAVWLDQQGLVRIIQHVALCGQNRRKHVAREQIGASLEDSLTCNTILPFSVFGGAAI